MHSEEDLNIFQVNKDNVEGTAASLSCAITGCQTSDGKSLSDTSALQSVGSAIAYTLSAPPAHTGEYIADVLKNANLVPQAYAQGLGFSSLSPVLVVWKAFRNMAYFVFILIFIIVGFMIMFRSQIDHQTVVTVQAALPKMVVTLLLITFSYAIAGFIVDLMYLTIYASIGLFEVYGILKQGGANQALDALMGLSLLDLGIWFFAGPDTISGGAANAVSAIVQGLIGIPSWPFDWLVDTIAYLIIAVAVLIAMFRTFFALLQAYIGIIMGVIFAPIQLLFNALPNGNTFGPWLKGIIANAALFPVIAIMIIIGAYLVGEDSDPGLGINIPETNFWGSGSGRDAGAGGFVPPLITAKGENLGLNDSEEFGPKNIRAIIGLGFIMLLPEIAKVVKKALGAEDSGLGEMAVAGLQKGQGVVSRQFGVIGGFSKTVAGGLTSSVLQGAGGAIWQNAILPRVEPMISKMRPQQVVTQKTMHGAMKMHRTRLPNAAGQNTSSPAEPAEPDPTNTEITGTG
jgi:hypothetical protein